MSNRETSNRLRRTCFLLVALLASVLCAVLVPAVMSGQARAQQAPVKSWDFEAFDTSVTVNTDGSLSVAETQIANFQGSFHFLNRDLTSAEASFDEGRTYGRVRYTDIEVFDLAGHPWKDYKVQNIKGGKRVRIEFSATDRQMGWVIKYRMTGAIIYAKDYDRLYFNTVSYQRDVAIKGSRTEVKMPAGTDMSKVRTTQYPNQNMPPASLDSGREGNVLWWETTQIPPYTTLTVDVAFPKGTVKVPLAFRGGFGAVMITLAALLALGASGGMTLLWYRKGRDIGAPELDVVRYQPPEDLRPAEVGFLMSEGSKLVDLTATIVDLAIRKKLVINEGAEKGLLKQGKFSFQKWEPAGDDVAPYERELLSGLFEKGDTVTEDDLENKFYTHIPTINTDLKEQVLGKGLFDGDPAKVKHHYYLIGFGLLALIALVAFLNRWVDPGYVYAFIPALAVSGLVVIGFGHYMPRHTAKGSQQYSYVSGFKEYMSTAEREEMKFMTPENFQANLPYAMVLGVAKEWADKFKDIYTSPPDWYRGSYPGAFSTVYLVDSLSRMETSVSSTLMSSPSSSSSGGGGGFGGGSSGGGFGGGGSSAG